MRFTYFLFGSNLLLAAMLLVHRFLHRKLPPQGLYALWLIPAIRLMLPFGWLELPQTGMPGVVLGMPYRLIAEAFDNQIDGREGSVSHAAVVTPDPLLMEGIGANKNIAPETGISDTGSVSDVERAALDNDFRMSSAGGDTRRILLVIWGMGSAVCACYALIVNGKMLRSVKEMERLDEPETELPVYCGKAVRGSCLFGLFRPCILMNCDAARNPKLYPYLLRHEKAHYRQMDPMWTVLRILLCAAYWWNPLVWAAAACAQEDGELACDARALRGLTVQERRAYAYALLQIFQSGGRQNLLYEAVCAGGGRGGMKKRIAAIAEKHQHRRGLCTAVCLILALAFLFGICLPKSTYAAGVQDHNAMAEVPEGGTGTGNPKSEENRAPAENVGENSNRAGKELNSKEPAGEKETEAGAVENAEASEDVEMAQTDAAIDTENLTYLSPLPHREGYQEANVQLTPVSGLLEEMPSAEVQRSCDKLAQRALRELYDLTGYQVTECVYTATPLGSFYFGRTKEDLVRSRNFYIYQFAMEERVISSFSIASARRVWYSDVQQLLFPADASGMSREELALWYLQHSGLCPEGYVAEIGLVYETEPELIKVTMTDGSFYEVHMDMEILAVEAVYGPYPQGAEH